MRGCGCALLCTVRTLRHWTRKRRMVVSQRTEGSCPHAVRHGIGVQRLGALRWLRCVRGSTAPDQRTAPPLPALAHCSPLIHRAADRCTLLPYQRRTISVCLVCVCACMRAAVWRCGTASAAHPHPLALRNGWTPNCARARGLRSRAKRPRTRITQQRRSEQNKKLTPSIDEHAIQNRGLN